MNFLAHLVFDHATSAGLVGALLPDRVRARRGVAGVLRRAAAAVA